MSTESPVPIRPAEPRRDYLFDKTTYDRIKFLAQYALPALGTLYMSIALVWDLPYGKQIVLTITALDVFLGVLLGYSSKGYNNSENRFDGEVVVTGNPEAPHSLVFNVPLSELESQPQITLKVTSP